jgi:hypothetical protein
MKGFYDPNYSLFQGNSQQLKKSGIAPMRVLQKQGAS